MQENKLDILAFGAHPDDVELAASGTIIRHVSLGYKVGIIDLTRGELGTRGTPELRREESERASKILGIHARETLDLRDGFFTGGEIERLAVIQMVRKYRPEIVLCNAIHDRHPDHGRAGQLVAEACYYSGLRKIETELDGATQEAWRPKAVYHYIQDHYIAPAFVVDITEYIDQKMEAVRAYSSQFYSRESKEPETPLTSPGFLEQIKGRCREMGRPAGIEYAEGFTVERVAGVRDLFGLM